MVEVETSKWLWERVGGNSLYYQGHICYVIIHTTDSGTTFFYLLSHLLKIDQISNIRMVPRRPRDHSALYMGSTTRIERDCVDHLQGEKRVCQVYVPYRACLSPRLVLPQEGFLLGLYHQ